MNILKQTDRLLALSSKLRFDERAVDQGYGADRFQEYLKERLTRPFIPCRKTRKINIKYDKRRYKRRNRIDRMLGRIKDWRRNMLRQKPDRLPQRHQAHSHRYIFS